MEAKISIRSFSLEPGIDTGKVFKTPYTNRRISLNGLYVKITSGEL